MGLRIVEFDVLGKRIFHALCNNPLHLSNIESKKKMTKKHDAPSMLKQCLLCFERYQNWEKEPRII